MKIEPSQVDARVEQLLVEKHLLQLEKTVLLDLVQSYEAEVNALKDSIQNYKNFIRKYTPKEFTDTFFSDNQHLSQNFVLFAQLGSESGTTYDQTFICGSTIRTYTSLKSDFESTDQTYGRLQFPKSDLGEFVIPIPKDLEEFRKDLQQLEK